MRADISPEKVRAQLARILGHRDFEVSSRTREFLRFVASERSWIVPPDVIKT